MHFTWEMSIFQLSTCHLSPSNARQTYKLDFEKSHIAPKAKSISSLKMCLNDDDSNFTFTMHYFIDDEKQQQKWHFPSQFIFPFEMMHTIVFDSA